MAFRVLCLGAYANGNVGDMAQAEALTAMVLAARPDAEVVSISPSARGSAYPARNHTAGPVTAAFDHDYINSFDVLLVGGGGLIAAPHRPLNDAEWVAGLKIPCVTVAVGAAGDTPGATADFLRKCRMVSVRDEFSHAAVAGIRPDAEIVMDPILLAGPRSEPLAPAAERRGILWVPGKLVPGTVPLYDDLMMRLLAPRSDLIVSLNPETDRRSGFPEVFGDTVVSLDSAEDFQAKAQRHAFVVSERYHGCILALTAGVPCVGLSLRNPTVTSKIDELFRRIGRPGCTIRLSPAVTRQSLRALAMQLDFAHLRSYLAAERARLQDFVARAIAP